MYLIFKNKKMIVYSAHIYILARYKLDAFAYFQFFFLFHFSLVVALTSCLNNLKVMDLYSLSFSISDII